MIGLGHLRCIPAPSRPACGSCCSFSARALLVTMKLTGIALGRCTAQTPSSTQDGSPSPNIILIMTDDQGYGDVGFHGNRVLKTPHLDRLAGESVELPFFYVTPVCSTTRAGLLTGRYHYRTGVTNVGGCGDRIKANELTIAEALQQAGYATAIFGKWHLGDNYPMRPQDQGFQQTVIHKGCCLTPWFRPDGRNYFDPYLFHNGTKQQFPGYCMDVYTDLAIEFMRSNQHDPFFIYLATNTPHTPLVVDKKYSRPYRMQGLDDKLADYYGTITNIDDNLGRLLDELNELGLANNTLVVFLTDNGPVTSQQDWPLALRGHKSTVYEGGIRVPCLMRWPAELRGGTKIDRIAAYIDIMPTLLDAAGVHLPVGVKIDGVSLLPLLRDPAGDWPDRTLFIQWHQGLQPEIYRSFAVRSQRYKLVQARGHQAGSFPAQERKYELYELPADPCEENDISAARPDQVENMKRQYEHWFADVMKFRGAGPQRIHIGSEAENPTRLMASGSYVNQDVTPSIVTGQWPARVVRSGEYAVKMFFRDGVADGGRLHFRFGKQEVNTTLPAGATEHTLAHVQLDERSDTLEAYVESQGKRITPTCVDVQWLPSPN